MKELNTLLMPILLVISIFTGQNPTLKYGLPELHSIRRQTLSPSYSCRSAEDFQQGYQQTALFLSDFSKRRNSPDLLFNGACKSTDYFDVSTAGDDMSLIADLGDNVAIEDVTAHLAFNLQGVATPDAYTKFTQTALVKLNHTYVVLINKSELRGLFVFTVTDFEKNNRVELKYAVKAYQIMNQIESSKGFDWGKKNSEQ